ncbi:MAG: MlaD family protein [Rhodospirillales bacterium]|nr:MlaD family protein [Rhodospirillales bacterium]
MGRNLVESVLGAVVLLVAGMFVYFAYSTAEIKAVEGYEVTAAFFKVGGLKKGSDVRISGIKVGTVVDLSLDAETYDALATLSIMPTIKLPADTVAAIASDGILGGKYVRLEPGRDEMPLESGEIISRTKDFRSLEDQVGEIIFLATGGSDSNGSGD